jgi:uncharacterized cupredoxin-like copper-binding protein
VLIPLVSTGAIAVAVRPAWRRRFGAWLVGATALIVIATLLAVSSGEAFDDLLNNTEPIEHHQQLAKASRLLVIVLFVAMLALVLIGRYRDRSSNVQGRQAWTAWLMVSLAAFTVFAAVSSTVWIIRTGHEGTRVVWRNISREGESATLAGPVNTATVAGGNVTPMTGLVSVTITDYSLNASGKVLKAGTVSFSVRNDENDSEHEFVVMKGKFAELPKTSNGAVDETRLAAGALIGRTALISPGNSTTATHTLDAGSYVFLCNVSVGPNSHAQNGQRLDVAVE